MDERFLEQLRAGQAVVVADAFAAQRLPATILSIAPEVDAQRGAVEVKFSLDQPPPFLREDMTLSAEVETRAASARWCCRRARALRSGPTGEVMLVAQAGAPWSARCAPACTLDAVEILSGIQEGELVLLAPTLQPGARVRVQRIEWQPSRSPQQRGPAASGDAVSPISQTMGR